MMNRAYFLRKEKELSLSRFVVEKVIELPQSRYVMFSRRLLLGYDFLRDNQDLMYVDSNGVWHCLLVKAEGAGDGILVNAEGSEYARYVAYCPDCSAVGKQESGGEDDE
jgi:hypothetical protein